VEVTVGHDVEDAAKKDAPDVEGVRKDCVAEEVTC
jgi:hypothetical protein